MNDEEIKRGKTLKQAVDASSYTPADIARIYNVTPQAVNHWFKRGASAKFGVELGRILEIAPNKISSSAATTFVNNTAKSVTTHINPHQIPILSFKQVSTWIEEHSEIDTDNIDTWLLIDGNFSTHSFALIVEGDSMTSPNTPSIPHGCTIIADPDVKPQHGSLVIARHKTGEITFKRLAVDGYDKYLEPLNDRYQSIKINNDYKILAVVRKSIMSV